MKQDTDWKKEFDREFIRDDGLMDKYVDITDPLEEMGFRTITTGDAIKSFISTLLTTQRAKEREEIIELAKNLRLSTGGTTGRRYIKIMGHNHALAKFTKKLKAPPK